jgi:retron-type reverse transcriptase
MIPLLSTFLHCFQQINKTYHSKNYPVRFSVLLLVQNELWVAYITHYTVTNFKMDVKRKWKPA